MLKYSLLTLLVLALIGGVWFYVKVKQEFAKLTSDDPEVWESVILEFEAQDREAGTPEDAVLFVGSSSIRFWRKLKSDMAPIPVIQRGFGGSKLHDLIHYVDRIITPYNPKAIVMFAGTNDITGRPNDKTAEQVAADFQELVQLIRRKLPETPIYYLSITPTTARWAVWPELRRANEMIAAFTAQEPNLHFLDASPFMLNADGTCNDDVLFWDGVHLNRKGYEIWAKLVKERLQQDLYPSLLAQ